MTLVLIVDDKSDKLASRVALLEALDCNVVPASSPDEAIRHLRQSPNFDLVISDINFAEPGDTSAEADSDARGIAFGEWLQHEGYPTTVAGYSGHFGDETPISKRAQKIFSYFAPKGKVDSEELLNLFEHWILVANKNKQNRLETAHLKIINLEELKKNSSWLPPDLEQVRRLHLDVSATPNDEALISEGYSLEIVQPLLPDGKPAGRPFLLWIRMRDVGADVEVYQIPTLYCHASTVEDALDSLSDLMLSYFLELRDDVDIGGAVLALKDFLESIFSSSGGGIHGTEDN